MSGLMPTTYSYNHGECLRLPLLYDSRLDPDGRVFGDGKHPVGNFGPCGEYGYIGQDGIFVQVKTLLSSG